MPETATTLHARWEEASNYASYALTIMVVDSNGNPVENATVKIFDAGGSLVLLPRVTGGDGIVNVSPYELSPGGRYNVTVLHCWNVPAIIWQWS